MSRQTAAKKLIIEALKAQSEFISRIALANLVGMNDGADCRELRECIAEIVMAGECPIISSSDRVNGGYRIARTSADGEAFYQESLGRIKMTQKRLTGFKNALIRWFGLDTLPLEAESAATGAPEALGSELEGSGEGKPKLNSDQVKHQREELKRARETAGIF